MGFEPPPGYEDMLADAQFVAREPVWEDLEVSPLGTVKARRPGPDAVAVIAMSANPKLKYQERLRYLLQFVESHVAEGVLDGIYYRMMLGEYPKRSVELVARELSVWGTARPYAAVVSLSVMAAYHWRTIRHKLLLAGVLDPMAMRSMHAVLDIAESMAVESAANSEEPEREVAGLYRRLYGPHPDLGLDDEPVPAGFDPDEVEDSFDAFARAAR